MLSLVDVFLVISEVRYKNLRLCHLEATIISFVLPRIPLQSLLNAVIQRLALNLIDVLLYIGQIWTETSLV